MNSMESFFASLLAGSPPLAFGSSMEKRGMINGSRRVDSVVAFSEIAATSIEILYLAELTMWALQSTAAGFPMCTTTPR